jgi:hypothetical protein
MRLRWDGLGAKLGVGVTLLGFVLIFFGWNGAASSDRLQSQFPYLISGGLAGLGLVIVGAALILVETSREERERTRTELLSLREAIERFAAPSPDGAAVKPAAAEAAPTGRGAFVAGQWTYHRPSCRLLEGRGELERVTREQIAERNLAACRVCEPGTEQRPRRAARKARRARR